MHVSRIGASRRLVYQKLNEKLLSNEISAIDEIVSQSLSSARSPRVEDVAYNESLVKERTLAKARRMMGISRKSDVNSEKIRQGIHVPTYASAETQDDLSSYSKRLSKTAKDMGKYMSLGNSAYSDLTHSELRHVQELNEKKKMLDRKIKWLKNNQIIDPAKFVTKEMKKQARDEYKARSDEAVLGVYDGGPMFPAQFGKDFDPVMAGKIKKVEFAMARDTAISRMRSEIRQEKLERSAIMKTSSPSIGGVVTDPLKRHLKRRNVRVSLLLQQYLEEILSCNSAQIVIDHLKGAALSIDRIESPTTRGRHDVFVRVTSDHDKKWLQEKLDVLAPKLRSQLAVRVNYGYTPELKFHIVDDVDKFNKNRLMRLADEARVQVDKQLNNHFMKEMNWK